MLQYGGWNVSLSSLNNAAAGLRPPVHVLSWPDALRFCYALRQVLLGRWLADFPSLGCWLQVLLFSGGRGVGVTTGGPILPLQAIGSI
jgi:hypothetical protein